MTGGFAIVPEDPSSPSGLGHPVAVFEHLEDALEWAALRFAARPFRIRYVSLLETGGDVPLPPRS